MSPNISLRSPPPFDSITGTKVTALLQFLQIITKIVLSLATNDSFTKYQVAVKRFFPAGY